MRREDSKMKELVSGYGETWSSQVSAKQLLPIAFGLVHRFS